MKEKVFFLGQRICFREAEKGMLNVREWSFRILIGTEGKEIEVEGMREMERKEVESWLEIQLLEALDCMKKETDGQRHLTELSQ